MFGGIGRCVNGGHEIVICDAGRLCLGAVFFVQMTGGSVSEEVYWRVYTPAVLLEPARHRAGAIPLG